MNFNFFQSVQELGYTKENYVGQFGESIIPQDYASSLFVLVGITETDFPVEANLIREEIYKMTSLRKQPQMADLGNFTLLGQEEFSHHQLRDAISFLLQENKIPIVFGGSRKTMYALQTAFAEANIYNNIGFVHENFTVSDHQKEIVTDHNFLWRILNNSSSHLFNICQIGYQTYIQRNDDFSILKQLHFDALRLGKVRDNIQDVEPLIRDLNLLGVSLNALKYAENGGLSTSSPNGLYNEELAQLFRYAGMSDRLKCLAMYDLREEYLNQPIIAAKVFAQAFWCFIEGYMNRKNEIPDVNDRNYTKYTVQNTEAEIDFVFLKSERSGRWWIKMPKHFAKLERDFYIPCSYSDYEIAMEGDIPERYLKGFNKLG